MIVINKITSNAILFVDKSKFYWIINPKMRFSSVLLTSSLNNNARAPQRKPVPFQMLLPLELKKTVSSKGEKSKEAACMQELAVLFACFKKNDFDQQECLKEITSFQSCYKDYSNRMNLQKEQDRKGILSPGEKKLTHKQMNQFLKAFPPKKAPKINS